MNGTDLMTDRVRDLRASGQRARSTVRDADVLRNRVRRLLARGHRSR